MGHLWLKWMGHFYGLNGWGIYGLNGWGIYDKWVGHLWLKWIGWLVTVFGRYAQNEYWSSGEYPFRSSHDHGFRSL